MDEGASAPLHRWLSCCRMLMCFHPRVGAQRYSVHLDSRSHHQPGWNAIYPPKGSGAPVQYTWIDPEGKEGRTTPDKPDVPDDQIRDIFEDAIPRLEDSAAWARTCEMAELVAGRPELGFTAEAVNEIMSSIRAAASRPVRGTDEVAEREVRRGCDQMKSLIARGNTSARELTEPARDIVRGVLDFRLTGTQAASALAALLAVYARAPSPLGSDFESSVDVAKEAGEYLIDRVTALKNDRGRTSLGSYHEMTYLAFIYANAACTLMNEVGGQLPETSEERRSLLRSALYIDEVAAHELGPTMMHPIDLTPCHPSEVLHATSLGILEGGGMYPGAAGQGKGPVDFEAITDAIASYSADADSVDVRKSIETDYGPVGDDLLKRLTMFLVVMEMGR